MQSQYNIRPQPTHFESVMNRTVKALLLPVIMSYLTFNIGDFFFAKRSIQEEGKDRKTIEEDCRSFRPVSYILGHDARNLAYLLYDRETEQEDDIRPIQASTENSD